MALVPWILSIGCADPDPVDLTEPVTTCTPTIGEVCTVAGTGERGNNGQDLPALDSWLFQPSAALQDPDGRVIVVDYNNVLVRRLDDDGVLRTVVGNGAHSYAIDGIDALECGVENPTDAAYGPDGSLFVYEQHGARVLKVDPEGWVTVYAGSPISPGYDAYDGDGGPAREAGLSQGVGVAVGDDGTLYIADTGNNVIRQVTPDGTIGLLAGAPATATDGEIWEPGAAGFADGVGSEARFYQPWGITWAADGMLYVADRMNCAIRRIDPATAEVVTIAGTPPTGGTLCMPGNGRGFAGDGGPATSALLSGPLAVDQGPDGALYIADADNYVIRRVDADGTITTVAGRPGEYPVDSSAAACGDGRPPEDALFNWPNDVLVTADGDVYVVDTLDARLRVIPGLAAP